MNRCEDFPCCGHYDRDGAFCPSPDGTPAPVVYFPRDDEDRYYEIDY